MYIPKRWLIPGALSLILGVMILINLLNALHGDHDASPRPQLVSATQPAVAVAQPAAAQTPPGACNLTPEQVVAFAAYVQGAEQAAHQPPPVTVVDQATNSGIIAHSQFNDGGFGDIGQQWRNVKVNQPVTNTHVSGTDNTISTNVNSAVNSPVNSNNTTTVIMGGPPAAAPAPAASPSPAVAPTTPAPETTAPSGPPSQPSPAGPTTPSGPPAPSAPSGPPAASGAPVTPTAPAT